MKTTEQISVELFIRQEAEFKTWVKSYYEGAFYLDWFKKEMGDDWFADWMGKTFRPDQIEVIGDMIDKLHHMIPASRFSNL